MAERYTCPVCGYAGLEEPPRAATGGGSNEYCPCCAFQFGYHDDDLGITDERWRADWIAAGMPWRIKSFNRPDDWDPRAQLDALLSGGT